MNVYAETSQKHNNNTHCIEILTCDIFHHFEICANGPVTFGHASPNNMTFVVFSCIMSKNIFVALAISHWN